MKALTIFAALFIMTQAWATEVEVVGETFDAETYSIESKTMDTAEGERFVISLLLETDRSET